MRIFYLLCLKPLDEEREMIRNLFTIKDPIDHVAAEQSHLYLISCMRINLIVLMDRLEDIGCC